MKIATLRRMETALIKARSELWDPLTEDPSLLNMTDEMDAYSRDSLIDSMVRVLRSMDSLEKKLQKRIQQYEQTVRNLH